MLLLFLFAFLFLYKFLDLLDLHSFPTRRSSDLPAAGRAPEPRVPAHVLRPRRAPSRDADRGGIAALGRAGLLCGQLRSEEHTSELQSRSDLVCSLLLEKKNLYCKSHLHIMLVPL